MVLTATGSSALTLGRVQGVALIGRPLNVAVRVELDAPADAAELCLVADVFYGDTRLDRNRVTISVDAAGNGAAIAQLRSNVAVDEPVVTVYLQAGCVQKLTRRFVLLAEQPGDAPAPALRAAESVAAVPQVPTAVASRGGAPGQNSAAAGPGAGQAVGARGGVAAEPANASGRGSAARDDRRPAQRTGRARLRLDPLDLGAEREPSLRLSGAMSAGAQSTPQQRAEAAAYWKALSARPEEILHDAQRMQALEGDLRGLREAVIKNTSAVSELRAQLGQARDERYSNPVVYVLALLLLAALALAAWTRRGRGAGPRDNDDWWRNAVEEAKAGAPRPAHSRPAEAEAPAARYEPQMSMPVPLEPRAAASVSQFRSSRSELTEFHQSQPGSLRATKAEEVHDVQQQADFFTSLGEHERAIEVLRSHINLHPETSPVAWLDLLAIYHRLHLREDYEATRAEFGQVFNAQAPHFDAYRLQVQSNGLESYPEALERITALWTSPKVLDLLETAIFRRPGEEGGHPFGLEAYRELLLLHSIAKEIAESEDNVAGFASSSGFTDFDRTQIQPLSALAPPPQQRNTALSSFPSLGKQGLDIDKGLDIDIDIDQLAPPDDFLQIIGAERELDSDGPTLLDFKLPEMDEATSEFDRRPPKPPRAAG